MNKQKTNRIIGVAVIVVVGLAIAIFGKETAKKMAAKIKSVIQSWGDDQPEA